MITLFFINNTAYEHLDDALEQAIALTKKTLEPQEVHRRHFGCNIPLYRLFNNTPIQLQSASKLVAETAPLYLEHPTDTMEAALAWHHNSDGDDFPVTLFFPNEKTLFLRKQHEFDAQNIVRSAATRRAWIDNGTMVAWRGDREVARLPDATPADKIAWVVLGELPEEAGRGSCPACNGSGVIISQDERGRMNVEKCDECGKFPSDEAAAEALDARLYGEKDPPIWVTHKHILENKD